MFHAGVMILAKGQGLIEKMVRIGEDVFLEIDTNGGTGSTRPEKKGGKTPRGSRTKKSGSR